MSRKEQTVEYRGCRKLVYAEILTDNNVEGEGYTTGPVKVLAPVQEVSKSTETSSEAKYYDNAPKFTIDGEGADTLNFIISVPDDEVMADITGRVYDEELKAFIEAPRAKKYFAVGYILGEEGSANDEKMVWKHKCTFGMPEETSHTKDDGTEGNNLTLPCTCLYTDHEFENGGGKGKKASIKGWYKRTSDGVTEEDFFGEVTTPDTVFA